MCSLTIDDTLAGMPSTRKNRMCSLATDGKLAGMPRIECVLLLQMASSLVCQVHESATKKGGGKVMKQTLV